MEFTDRPIKNFIFIHPEGYNLEFRVDLPLVFNPLAKKSKGRFQPI
jgi:hypothetical protein